MMWSAKIIITFFFLIVLAINGINSNHTDTPLTQEGEDEILYQRIVEIDQTAKKITNSAIKYVLPHVMEAYENINMSSQCSKDLFFLLNELRKLKLAPILFLDAAGKIPGGFLLGRNFLIGDYDECVYAIATRRNGRVAFKGQYCVVSVKPLLPEMRKSQTLFKADDDFIGATKSVSEIMSYFIRNLHIFYFRDTKLGICVPTGCSTDDINDILRYLGGRFDMNAKVQYCDYEDKYPIFRPRMILAICILSLLGLLAFIGTIVDYVCKERNIPVKNLGVRFMICFSIQSNFPKVVSTKTSEKALRFLCGIRSLSLFHIILLNQFSIMNEGNMITHLMKALNEMQSFFFNIISNGMLAIDVFFFVGGLVNCYSRMKMNENSKQKEKPLQLFIRRLWRIYPALILITVIIPNIFDQVYGPGRIAGKEFFRNCDKNWWKNLIFVNNFFDQKETVCMPHTWYISADMHLFIVSLFTIPVLFKHAKLGIILHLGIIFGGLISATAWALHKRIVPAGLVSQPFEKDTRLYWNAYSSTPPHIATYYAGVLIGYFLYVKKDLKIPTHLQVFGWPAAGVLFTWMLFWPVRWNNGMQYTSVEGALYFSFSRLLYVLAVSWMILCCATGHGGIINYILSLKLWIVIARMSYMMYLVSAALQQFYSSNLRVLYDYDNMVLIWRHLTDILISGLLSLVLAVIVESPFLAMEKQFCRKSSNLTSDAPVKGNDNPMFINNYEKNIDVISQNNLKNVIDTEKL